MKNLPSDVFLPLQTLAASTTTAAFANGQSVEPPRSPRRGVRPTRRGVGARPPDEAPLGPGVPRPDGRPGCE